MWLNSGQIVRRVRLGGPEVVLLFQRAVRQLSVVVVAMVITPALYYRLCTGHWTLISHAFVCLICTETQGVDTRSIPL